MRSNGTLSMKQARFVRELLTSPTVKGAAEAAGVGLRTGWKYLQDEKVQAKLRPLQDALLSGLTATLLSLGDQALEVLHDVMGDVDATDAVKVRAAQVSLSHIRHAVELQDLAARVAALEQAIGG